ncbi:hypothetical protein LX64_01851 [Chitinophaga skermanii]|uniref:Uncharacterized protein n=1 Tax=Chitinophaga skermanii TaxID=331697 RepID=A0A327QSW0_9BACT|nr:hypothetical protein [Chitinophaga skermanii]RAJ06724.1 hypothetical protein LX64_01851 [Chitinophaga skermanii]
MKRSFNKCLPYLVFLVIGCFFIKAMIRDKQLTSDFKIVPGGVVNFYADYKGSGGSVKYSFEVNGQIYHGLGAYPTIYSSRGYSLIGESFPVAYQVDDLNNNRMLITTTDFKEFNLAFPDSLAWIKKMER